MRHRVNSRLIEETVTGLQGIHKEFSDYYWYATSKAQSSFARVYRAMEIFIDIAGNDMTSFSTKLKEYNDAYNLQEPGIIDDAFVKTMEAANSKISLFVQHLGTLTDIKFMQQFHDDFEGGNRTIKASCCETDYDLCCTNQNKMFNFNTNDETLAENLKIILVELLYAGTEVSSLIDSTPTQSSSGSGFPVLPLDWTPGIEWQTLCKQALKNISEAHSSLGHFLDDIHSHNSMNNIYEMAFKFYDLQQHGVKAIQCRNLYSDALKATTTGMNSIIDLINDCKEVSMVCLYICNFKC